VSVVSLWSEDDTSYYETNKELSKDEENRNSKSQESKEEIRKPKDIYEEAFGRIRIIHTQVGPNC